MGGCLDRYVARIVLGSYGAGLLFMILLFTLIDILLNLGVYLNRADARGVGLAQMFVDLVTYYAIFQPIVFVTIAPFVSVIAGMFAVARLLSMNELAPMLFTGRSVFRILTPLFLTAGLSAVSMVACWEWVVPAVAEPLQAASTRLRGGLDESMMSDVVVELPAGATRRTLFVGEYHHRDERMLAPTLVERGETGGDVVLIQAAEARWDPEIEDWRLIDGRRHTERVTRAQTVLGVDAVTPDLLWRSGKEGRDTVVLSYSELLDLQGLRPGRRDFVLAFHSHLTFPIANLILLLLSLPFALHFERGGKVERVVFAVVLCGAYFITDLTCQNLGLSMLHPVLAAWLPTILFGSFGVAFFGGIRT